MTISPPLSAQTPLLGPRRRWTLLVTVGTGLLLITLDNSILYTALPTLTRELDASWTESLWIINAYPLVMTGLLLGTGTLGDRFGHRRMFLTGLVVFGLASFMAATAPTPEVLIAARGLLAVGAAAMMPATLALIRVAFVNERERNVAISVWGSLSVVGGALGPIVGGALLEHFAWGSIFLINVPVVVVAVVLGVAVAPKNDPHPGTRWDFISSVQALATLVGLVVLIKEVVKVDRSGTIVLCAALATFVGWWLFVRRQRRLPFPLLDLSIFRNAAFASGVLAAAFAMFAMGGLQLATTQRFQLVAGFSPFESGLLVAAIAVGSLPSSILGGAFLHVVGLRVLIGGGLGVGAVGVAWTLVGVQHGMGWLLGGLLVTGFGLGSAMSVASTAIIGNVPARRAGMASSVEEVSYEFGSLAAVALLGSLLTTVYTMTIRLPDGAPVEASRSMTDALTAPGTGPEVLDAASRAFGNSYSTVMVVCAAVLAVGAIVTTVLLRTYGPGSESSAYGSSH
ncbi:MFS transporter, DHA2 family, multidrug resistance protein [Promicromonospora umidemergens]|uniref:MFS transporter n=1 Tax=Promicromonospora umidemergens TaxID=629679 RepID=A0ABP8WTP5_9MICO|nr:MFS transporter [Promicromonospora umidemergens]MCP2283497.1 MFS transporter, DHA2 family, multidrug resistance protein [Promicromonospora umidemergens]